MILKLEHGQAIVGIASIAGVGVGAWMLEQTYPDLGPWWLYPVMLATLVGLGLGIVSRLAAGDRPKDDAPAEEWRKWLDRNTNTDQHLAEVPRGLEQAADERYKQTLDELAAARRLKRERQTAELRQGVDEDIVWDARFTGPQDLQDKILAAMCAILSERGRAAGISRRRLFALGSSRHIQRVRA